MNIDLNVGAELLDELSVEFNGHSWTFPGSLSIARLTELAPLIDKVQGGGLTASETMAAIRQLVVNLVGEEQTADVFDVVPSSRLELLVVSLLGAYGAGEAEASQRSTKNTGKRSRPTSKGSTESTSVEPSTGQATNIHAA